MTQKNDFSTSQDALRPTPGSSSFSLVIRARTVSKKTRRFGSQHKNAYHREQGGRRMNHEETQETPLTVSTELTEPRDSTENTEKSSKEKKAINDEEMQQFVSTIASWLEETEKTPLWYLRKIVRKAGYEQTMALLKEVLAIEQQGGMLVEDQSRRRTIGGVFFYLSKQKGYLKQKFYPKHGQPQHPTTTSQPSQSTQPVWNWEDRLVEIAELRKEQGATNVKITLIGRPGQIANRRAFVLTTMQSSKVPAFPN